MADIRKFLAVSLLFAAPLCAQSLCAQSLPDPANLTGEHVIPQSPADTLPINHGAPALQQLLQKLRTRASMLLVVAHPDDEDGGFLTYESRGQGARVGMLTLNRGEGGQNLMTGDFDDALGLLRTQELLAADRYMGVDQFFATVADFGFSKTKEETLEKWTHDRVLYDAVRVVRLYRPLIIASVFVGGPTDGHGQHQVSGEIAQEVFVAAADPNVFPEMGLPPWAPLKVYARTPFARVTNGTMHDSATGKDMPVLFHNYVTGADLNQPPAATVQIHEGEVSTQLGMDGDTYGSFARRGLALQKSQIGGNGGGGGRGGGDASYTLMASRLCDAGSGPAPPGTPSPQAQFRQGPTDSELPGTPSLQAQFRQGPTDSELLGTPSLQARASQGPPQNGALAPGVCPPSNAPEQTPFDGIDASLPGIATLAPSAPAALRGALLNIDTQLAEAQRLFDPAHLELLVRPLRASLGALDGIIREFADEAVDDLPLTEKFNLLHELRIKRVQLNNALVLAHGLTLRANLSTDVLLTTAAGASVTSVLHNAGTLTVSKQGELVYALPADIKGEGNYKYLDGSPLKPGESQDYAEQIAFRKGILATRPYFSRPNMQQPWYDIGDPNLRNAPATPAPITVLVTVLSTASAEDPGVPLQLAAVAEPAGPSIPPSAAVVVPPISVALAPLAGIVRPQEKSFQLSASVRSSQSIRFLGGVKLFVANGTRTYGEPIPTAPPVDGTHSGPHPEGEQQETITVETSRIRSRSFTLNAVVSQNKIDYAEGFRTVGYPGITSTNYYTPAAYKGVGVDVITAPNLKVAYLPGTGDDVPAYLPNIGVTPTVIAIKDLTAENLKQYDAVVLGVRTYSAHPELGGMGSKPLLDYAAAGGVVITQYQNGRYTADEAPYPITTALSSGDHAHDVVVEEQPVKVLEPNAPLLSWPNKITSADFDNWVAERGHGFAGTWARNYTALLETHDPDQDPQQGSLLVAPVGKGAYIYCGLALYRQLPEGVPGAYRLYANLLSYAKNPKR